MKVDPNLFVPNAPSPRATGDAQEARRAFEAMLSASSARSRSVQVPNTVPAGALASALRDNPRVKTEEPASAAPPLSRPGRVLDIKV